MKSGIHPEVFKDAKTTCVNCNAVFVIPSTVKDQKVEACRLCHPVYTGKQQTERKGDRIERFRKRMAVGKKAA
ncbi:MAG: 50S ribosomal protein L31 [Candidatus Peregrinibacteria bacterium]|nr:50S ribosomal protein L31 [Candidatus Peregrinibacteria bacterium]